MKGVAMRLLLSFCSCLIVVTAHWFASTRRPMAQSEVSLSTVMPQRLGRWRMIPTTSPVVDPETSTDPAERTYDSVSTFTYAAARSQIVVVLAYRRLQEHNAKIHRPELCYFAQGYELSDEASDLIQGRRKVLPIKTFVAKSPERSEVVGYWIRIGPRIVGSAADKRSEIFREGLAHEIPDGLLVRASISNETELSPQALSSQKDEVKEFITALASQHSTPFLVGTS